MATGAADRDDRRTAVRIWSQRIASSSSASSQNVCRISTPAANPPWSALIISEMSMSIDKRCR